MAIAKNIKLVHRGQFICYYEIEYELSDGSTKIYEMTSKHGSLHSGSDPLTISDIGKEVQAVVLIVFNKDHSKMLLNRELRLGVNQIVYNNVAGLIDPGETPIMTAIRELREETGLSISTINDVLNASFTSAPTNDELINVIICTADDNETIAPSQDASEEITAEWFTKGEMKKLLRSDYKLGGRAQVFAYAWAYGLS